jgi:putative methionine-R-sulfoxide reductase with GAF domain
MALTHEDDKPWKTDLARKSAQRRDQVLREVEETVRKAGTFEDALRQAAELMKKRFARYTAVTVYVADGEDLVVHTSIDRPTGPERVWSGGGPLADAAHGHAPAVVTDLASQPAWAAVGLAAGSVLVAPVRTDAGLWATLEVWSDFREAFNPHDVKLIEKICSALAKKTPAT